MSNSVNAKLYQIDDSLIREADNTTNLIKEIVDNYNSKRKKSFVEIDISENVLMNNLKAKLYVLTTDNKRPDWYDFLTSIVKNVQDLNDFRVQFSSFVLFLYDEDSIYAISKGYYGPYLLQENINAFFGLEVLSRLVKKSLTEIKQIEERLLFGSEIGAQRYFRDSYNLAFDDDFGKIYKAMLASIEKEDFKKLGIIQKKESINKISITGSSSLEISSNFSYEELIDRVLKIKELLETEGVEFNQFHRLYPSELNPIKEEINRALLERAYNCYKKREVVDFFNPEIFSYLRSIETEFVNQENAVVTNIEFCSSYNYLEIIDVLIDKGLIDDTDMDSFIKSLESVKGGYKQSEDGIYTLGISLNNWVSGEVDFKGKKYFKLDKYWYIYKDSLDEYLNSNFEEIDFEDMAPPFKLEPWGDGTENEYNKEYKHKENFIVADMTYLNNIEIADIIKIEGETLYLYHVKKGLGQDTRVLINQITNAARYLTFHKNETGNDGLRRYFKSISKKYYDSKSITLRKEKETVEIDEDKFVKLFLNAEKIIFVFAYSSSSDKEIKEEIIGTKSRIAKLSLVYLIREMSRTDFDLQIEKF